MNFAYYQVVSPETVWAFPMSQIRARVKTPYQDCTTLDDGRGNTAHFINDEFISSSLDEWAYHEMLVHPAMHLAASRKRVLVLGDGDGGSLAQVVKYADVEMVTQVDLDEQFIRYAQIELWQWSKGAYQDARLTTVIADCCDWVKTQPRSSYDVIVMDLPTPMSAPTDLLGDQCYSAAFFSALTSLLAPWGVIVSHAGTVHQIADSPIPRIYRLFKNQRLDPLLYFCPEVRWSFVVHNPKPRIQQETLVPCRYFTAEMLGALGTSVPKYLQERL